MNDSRLTNAYYEIRADLYGIGKIQESLAELRDNCTQPESKALDQAIAELASARDQLAYALKWMFAAGASCYGRFGFSSTPCQLEPGHAGNHQAGDLLWDDETAERTARQIASSMGMGD